MTDPQTEVKMHQCCCVSTQPARTVARDRCLEQVPMDQPFCGHCENWCQNPAHLAEITEAGFVMLKEL